LVFRVRNFRVLNGRLRVNPEKIIRRTAAIKCCHGENGYGNEKDEERNLKYSPQGYSAQNNRTTNSHLALLVEQSVPLREQIA
jgi:hypothetical protein